MPIIADARLSATSQYAITENNKFKARNPKSLAERIDYWFEHQDELKETSVRYQAWAKELTVEKSAIRMKEIWTNLLSKKER